MQGQPAPEGYYRGPVLVTLEAQDNPGGAGLARIGYILREGGPVLVYHGAFWVDAEQVRYVTAAALDAAGNLSAASRVRVGPERLFLPVMRR